MLFSGMAVSIFRFVGSHAPNELLVHSQTLPTSCSTPLTLAPPGTSRTATVPAWPLPQMLARRRSIASPHGKRRCTGLPPSANTGQLAAFTHSASLGSRLPAHRAKAVASYHDTPTTG